MSEILTGTLDYLRNISAVEAGALIFGIGYVFLAAREKVLCWPIGIIGSILALILASKSNYRLDVVKEAYYVLMGFYGWYAWLNRGHTQAGVDPAEPLGSEATRPIVSYTARQIITVIVLGTLLSLLAGWFFDRQGSSLPYLDAGTTVFSFITTWLVTQKVLQNWLFWIVINAAAFYMYMLNGYYAFSLLILIYFFVSISGYFTWRHHFRMAKA